MYSITDSNDDNTKVTSLKHICQECSNIDICNECNNKYCKEYYRRCVLCCDIYCLSCTSSKDICDKCIYTL